MTRRLVAAVAVAATGLGVLAVAVGVRATPASLVATSDRSAAVHDAAHALYDVAEGSFVEKRDGTLFIIVAGTDDRPGVSGARNDALHIVGVNIEARRATILNIPRDTYVAIPGHGRQKITAAHQLGGPALLTRTIEGFTGVTADYVLTTNFAGFVNLVNDFGGVTIDIESPMRDRFSGANFDAGTRTLSGEEALAYARTRKALPRGDFDRTHNQGRLLIAALAAVRDTDRSLAETARQVGILFTHVRTMGLGVTDAFELTRVALSIDPSDVANITMPGTTGSAGGASVVFPAGAAGPLFADFADDALLE